MNGADDRALIERFLEMMRAEAGAAGNTIAAYGTDLRLASEFLQGGLGAAGKPEIEQIGRASCRERV